MKRRTVVQLMTLLAALLSLLGCGGGGGGGGAAESQSPPKSLNLTLSLTGVPASKVGSVDIFLDLPHGTAVATDQSGAVSSPDFIVTVPGSANGTSSIAKYLPASGSAPAKVHIIVVVASLVSNGEFATLHCLVPAAVAKSDFRVESVVAGDENGVPVAGVGVNVL